MKKILLLLLFGATIMLNASTLEENKKACDAGNLTGCSNLGVIYADGQGVKQDFSKAVDLFFKACDGGHAQGCYNLGETYTLAKDYINAAKLYTKACDGGYADGCDRLGMMYLEGKGVERDEQKAAKLLFLDMILQEN